MAADRGGDGGLWLGTVGALREGAGRWEEEGEERGGECGNPHDELVDWFWSSGAGRGAGGGIHVQPMAWQPGGLFAGRGAYEWVGWSCTANSVY